MKNINIENIEKDIAIALEYYTKNNGACGITAQSFTSVIEKAIEKAKNIERGNDEKFTYPEIMDTNDLQASFLHFGVISKPVKIYQDYNGYTLISLCFNECPNLEKYLYFKYNKKTNTYSLWLDIMNAIEIKVCKGKAFCKFY